MVFLREIQIQNSLNFNSIINCDRIIRFIIGLMVPDMLTIKNSSTVSIDRYS